MGITSSRIKLNNQWTNLTQSGNAYTATLTAPSITSHNQPGGYYPLTVEFVTSGGNTITKTATDEAYGSDLRLVVKETVSPVITILQPVEYSTITNPDTPIKFTIIDEVNGSGIDLNSFTMELDGEIFDVDSSEISYSVNSNGYLITYTPPTAMEDGVHMVIINCDDYDGNPADQQMLIYTIDTEGPVFVITYPAFDENLWINTSRIVLRGQAYDAYGDTTTVTMSVNGVDQGPVTLDAEGYFTKEIQLTYGINEFVAIASDPSLNTTTITRTYISLVFIYDRTAQDVNRVKYLNQQYLLGEISEDELEEWMTDSKGALNRSDLVRNETNMNIINTLIPVGVTADPTNIPELPTNTYYAQLLTNVGKFRALPYAIDTTPRVPDRPLNLYTKWNDIEKILYDVLTIWSRSTNSKYRAGNEIYCGESVGIL